MQTMFLLLLQIIIIGNKYVLAEFLKSAIKLCKDCSVILQVDNGTEVDKLLFSNVPVVIYNCDTLEETKSQRPNGGKFLSVQLSKSSCGFSASPDFFHRYDEFLSTSRHLKGSTKNFEGRVLSGICLDVLPFCKCHRLTQDGSLCHKVTGYECRTMEVVAAKLNFTLRLEVTPTADIDNKIAWVKDGRYDFLIGGITVSYKRNGITPLSTYMDFDNFGFLYVCRQSPWLQFKFLIMPFRLNVWLATLVVILVISFTLRCILFHHGNLSFIEALQDCTKALIELDVSSLRVERIESQFAAFITYTMLLYFGIVISTAYKSKLTSMVIKPPHNEPNSLQELIEQDYEISVSAFNRQLVNEILEGDDSLLHRVKSTAVYVPRMCDQVRHTVERRSAMFNEKILLLHRTQISCVKEIFPLSDVPNYSPYKLRLTKSNLRLNPHAWAVNPELRMWKDIQVILAYLNCGGLIDKWVEDADVEMNIRVKIPHARNNFPEENVVEFELYCTLVLFVGHTLALLAFSTELLRHRSKLNHLAL